MAGDWADVAHTAVSNVHHFALLAVEKDKLPLDSTPLTPTNNAPPAWIAECSSTSDALHHMFGPIVTANTALYNASWSQETQLSSEAARVFLRYSRDWARVAELGIRNSAHFSFLAAGVERQRYPDIPDADCSPPPVNPPV